MLHCWHVACGKGHAARRLIKRLQLKQSPCCWCVACCCGYAATTRKLANKANLVDKAQGDNSICSSSSNGSSCQQQQQQSSVSFWLVSTWKFRQLTPFSMLAKDDNNISNRQQAAGDNSNSTSGSSNNYNECVN